MPQAIAAAIIAAIGVSATGAVAAVITVAVNLAFTLAISAAANALFAPGVPKPQSVQTPIKQSRPVRRSAFGRVRVSGAYALYEAKSQTSYDVLALLDGESDAIERHYLNDDVVQVDSGEFGVYAPDGKKYAYGAGHDRVFFYHRLGLATETAYSQIVSALPGIWTNNHRGDGVTSIALVCKQSKPEFQSEDFPNGLPQPAVALRAQKVYDPRNGTTAFSENPILQTAAYLTTAAGGMGFDYARRIAPNIAAWKAAADVCDGAVALSYGGTEKRYRSGGVYNHDTAPSDVIGQLLATCDGWLAQKGDGSLTILAGKYYAPTVTIEDRHIVGYSIRHRLPDEEAVNELLPSFTNPLTEYQQDDAGSWRDEDDIERRGKIRSSPMELPWVPSGSQARRLAKRTMSRFSAPTRGTLTTNLYGMNALGERYLALQCSENAAIADIVIEVTKVEIDLSSMTLTFTWIEANPDVDEWTTAEETPGNEINDRPTPATLAAPVVSDVEVLLDGVGARLLITVASDFIDVGWQVRWRIAGSGTSWAESPNSDVDDGPSVILQTGMVPADANVEFQIRYLTAAAASEWSTAQSVSTDVSTVPPEAATSLDVQSWLQTAEFTTTIITRATSYLWSFYDYPGGTLLGTRTTAIPQLSYTHAMAKEDGVQRVFTMTVAGVNAAGTGTPIDSLSLHGGPFNNPAPLAPGVGTITGGTTAEINFTPGLFPPSDLAGWVLYYHTSPGFDPATDGTSVVLGPAGSTPFTLYGLANGTYYFKIAGFDYWSADPDSLNFTAEHSFTISGAISTPPSGGGSGGIGGGYRNWNRSGGGVIP